MKKLLCIILMFAGLTGFKPDSSRTITGIVTAREDGQPIPGVTVIIPGTTLGAQTNSAGKYSISVPKGYHKLVFSFVGYQRQVVSIGKADSLNVVMVVSGKELSEVVVTGYGVQRKSSITASVQTISPDYMKSKDINAALSGRVSGLIITKQNAHAYNKAVPASSAYTNNVSVPPTYANDESYQSIVENGFNNAKDNPLSTFSVDVDNASYSNMRRFINNGQLPPADAVRIEEMINYFNYDLSGPKDNEPVAIHTELSSAPWNPAHRLLRIGLKAKTIATDKLPPSNLVFLLDVSGSMQDANKLPLVKAAMKMLVDELRPKDKVTIVAYAGEAGLRLAPTSGGDKTRIDSAIDQLYAGGSTNGGEGIKLAYKMAADNFIENGNNRIIMATDGDFNVGPSSDGDMESLIVKERETNVAISIMGVGMGNVKDSKMETLADKGNGNYFYIDNITEARKALVSEFGGTMFTVAKDVKLQVEFNPVKVQAYRLLGYEDRILNKEDFNNDRKDAGDMGSGHTVTALYEIVPAGIKDDYSVSVDPLKYQKTDKVQNSSSATNEMLTIKFRYKQPDSMVSKLSQAVVNDNPENLNNTSADFKFAAAVAEFGMLLRDSQFKQKSNYDQAISLARAGKGEDNDGYRSEFIKLAESAKLLAKSELVSNK
ncbi:VWA domain-containing protein [Mucilaginibacter sp. L196]|uniref:vWA domain-containing protein n=1 Tax=Mucilaginibacter sp. L196 TaxID=1641870 RepID=UPI00131BEF16|nr:VWA domain-containing protein [Mucilaginibacter sp. L196]